MSETNQVTKERIVIFIAAEQKELAERLARQTGWDVPELNRTAHQLGLNMLAESNNKALINQKLGLKGEIANILDALDVDNMKQAIAYLKQLKEQDND